MELSGSGMIKGDGIPCKLYGEYPQRLPLAAWCAPGMDLYQFHAVGALSCGHIPGMLRLVLTWIVPVAFITTVPVEMLTKQVSPIMLVGGAGIALGLLLFASAFFRMSLRHYTGASS